MAISLVTGGAGFIGRHVAESLLKRGDRVIVLDDLSGGFERIVPAGAEFITGSLCEHIPAFVRDRTLADVKRISPADGRLIASQLNHRDRFRTCGEDSTYVQVSPTFQWPIC